MISLRRTRSPGQPVWADLSRRFGGAAFRGEIHFARKKGPALRGPPLDGDRDSRGVAQREHGEAFDALIREAEDLMHGEGIEDVQAENAETAVEHDDETGGRGKSQ